MKNITIRPNTDTESMLAEISTKPTVAVQEVLEVFTFLRRATLRDLKGKFTREEIIAMADSFNGLMPTWQIMVNPAVLVAHTEDAEKYQYSASSNGADINALLAKLETLSSAQATILQLELWAFWNRDGTSSPDLETLVKTLA